MMFYINIKTITEIRIFGFKYFPREKNISISVSILNLIRFQTRSSLTLKNCCSETRELPVQHLRNTSTRILIGRNSERLDTHTDVIGHVVFLVCDNTTFLIDCIAVIVAVSTLFCVKTCFERFAAISAPSFRAANGDF